MTLRCALLDDYQNVGLAVADWTPLTDRVDVTVFKTHFDSDDAVATDLEPFDIVVAMRERTPFTAGLLGGLPKLRLLVTTGMRNASIDVGAARARGVTVCGTGSLSDPPVELTWALILALAHNVVLEHNRVRAGGWQTTVGTDLRGSRLGLLGLGKIGTRVAHIGQAFGMDVVAWSPNLTAERATAAAVRFAPTREEVLESSDFVSIHLVLSDATRGLLGWSELRRMQATAYLINTSRSPIVESEALVEALQKGWIAGAGLDVFDIEPLPAGHILRSLPNVVTTPHVGYVSLGNYRIYYREAVEDILAFLSDAPIRVLDP